MAHSTKPTQTVPLPVLLVASLAGTVVALGAAVVSYSHMHDLCIAAGDTELLAGITPLLVDGMVVFASALLYAQKRLGERVEWLAVTGVVLGVAASLGANIVSKVPEAVDTDAVRLTVAAWPPLALGIVGHLAWQLLAIALRGRRQEAPQEAPQGDHRTFVQAHIDHVSIGSQEAPGGRPDAIPAPSREVPAAALSEGSGRGKTAPPKPARRAAPRKPRGSVPDAEWMPFLRHLRDTLGRDLTPNALKEASRTDGLAPHSLGHDRAKRLIERFQQEAV